MVEHGNELWVIKSKFGEKLCGNTAPQSNEHGTRCRFEVGLLTKAGIRETANEILHLIPDHSLTPAVSNQISQGRM